jgi:hypothetical protein
MPWIMRHWIAASDRQAKPLPVKSMPAGLWHRYTASFFAGMHPAIIKAATGNESQCSKHERIYGGKELKIMHAGLLLPHVP